MLRSLYAGIAGMSVNQTKLDVIGNNIANVGTTAFKGSTVTFEDMLSQNVSQALAPGLNQGGTNPKQVGLGVQVEGINTNATQGMMQPTSRNLDAAIDGEGYFVVANGPLNGNVPLTGQVVDTSTPGDMNISFTRDGSFTLDSDGNLLTTDGNRVMGYTINSSIDYSTTPATAKFVDANSSPAPIADDDKLVPLIIPDTVNNGGTPMRIQSFSIGKNGVISAVLQDGSVTELGQIAMASFKNPAGLTKLGKNEYSQSANSGAATFRVGTGDTTNPDNSKGYGDMLQGMLEMSNVDLAQQFTDMIVASRAFQANAKTITTGDEILQDILNIKR